MQLGNALIALIAQAQLVWQQGYSMQFEQAKIMYFPLAERSTDHLTIGLVDNYLCFQSVSLFLTTVVSSLFFSRIAKFAREADSQELLSKHRDCDESEVAQYDEVVVFVNQSVRRAKCQHKLVPNLQH